MGRKKRKDKSIYDVEAVDFKIESITAAPRNVLAVYDEGDGEWAVFPVVLFAVGTLDVKTKPHEREAMPGVVRGLVSNIGGLVLVEDSPDMNFVGYWRKNCQDWAEFLEDHDVEVPPDYAGEHDDEADDEDDDE